MRISIKISFVVLSRVIKAPCTAELTFAIPIIPLLRQARQDRLELVDDLSLDRSIVYGGLVVCITRADSNVAVASSNQDDVCLPRKARATAPVRVASTQKTSVDASKDVLELTGIAALGLGDRGEVDVQVGVRWEVWLSAVDDGGSDVQSQISVDLAVERCRSIPCGRISRLAREGDSWNLGRLCRICSCADGTGEGHLNSNIASDIRSGQSEFGLCAVPELRRGDIDTLLDRSNRERVHVVQTRVCRICTCGRASTWAGCMNAAV